MKVGPMLWIATSAWRYRTEILSLVKLVSDMRKSARDFTREYLRKRVRETLAFSMASVLFQICLLLAALLCVAAKPSLLMRMGASVVLWTITLWNLYRFVRITIPEIRAVRKSLRSKTGYTVRYLLRISLVTELLEWNLLLPAVCLGVAIATRSILGTGVSYFGPWLEALRMP